MKKQTELLPYTCGGHRTMVWGSIGLEGTIYMDVAATAVDGGSGATAVDGGSGAAAVDGGPILSNATVEYLGCPEMRNES